MAHAHFLEYSPVSTKYLREIHYLILKVNSFQFCGSNYLQTHGTGMGTETAIAFANIFMARTENQTLRQSCIEPYPGHQRIFLACGAMLQFPVQAGRSLAEGRSHLRRNREKKMWEKKAYRVGHYKDFTEPETYP